MKIFNISIMVAVILLILLFAFIIYLIFDRLTTPGGTNKFFDNWTKRLLFLWLPFYALPRLIKEIFFGKK